MFCFQIHARAYCTMNAKFSILHEVKLSAVLKISSSLYSKQVRVLKTKHELTVSNLLIFNLSSLLAIDLQWLPARENSVLLNSPLKNLQVVCLLCFPGWQRQLFQ